MSIGHRWRLHIRYAVWIAIGVSVVTAGWVTRLGTRWPSIYYMTGPSMEPTLRAGEYFLAWAPPQLEAGELVIFRFADEDGVFHVLRRLAALPGDTIAMEDGTPILNGRRQRWPFVVPETGPRASPLARTGDLFTWGPWVVPPDSVVLLADRRDMMGWPDSRFIGYVARSDILAGATRTLTGRKLRPGSVR